MRATSILTQSGDAMVQKISGDLIEHMEDIRQRDANGTVSVIVTLKAGANRESLQKTDLRIENVFENISAVSGSVSISGVNELAQLDEVELVEFDGEMHAL